MRRTFLFWIIAFVVTLASAYYQRITGPTYPLSGTVNIDGEKVNYKLNRSHSTSADCPVLIKINKSDVSGILMWKRFKTDDAWTPEVMHYKDGELSGFLPKQPAAGKLQYSVLLGTGEQQISVPPAGNVVIRFKGDVPLFILIPHILAMFGTMLLSTRTALECFAKEGKIKKYTWWTLGFLIAGGMILGPITQKYAFGALWTGFPFGMDLTDNKTLIALIGWILAAAALYKFKKPKVYIIGAAALLLIVFMIPHSMFGSELDYNKIEKKKDNIENINTYQHQTSKSEVLL